MLKKQTYDYTTNNFDQIVALTEYCSQKLEQNEWELISLNLLPPVYRFRFHCEKKRVWAILNT